VDLGEMTWLTDRSSWHICANCSVHLSSGFIMAQIEQPARSAWRSARSFSAGRQHALQLVGAERELPDVEVLAGVGWV
jgi:hypothetical protein